MDQSYLLRFFASDRDQPLHVFCGAPAARDAECPNCERPLLRYAELESSDPRLGLEALGRLPLLFCWRCELSQEPLHYRVLSSGAVELTRWARGEVQADFPYPDYPDAFPAGELVLEALDPADEEVLRALRSGEFCATELWRDHPHLVDPQHHCAASPLYLSEPPRLHCTSCAGPMRFLVAFGDACLDPRGFVGEPGVQVLFFLCSSCREVGVCQVCD
jgi:hypothetical protein